MSKKSDNAKPFIKGYLPVRLKLVPTDAYSCNNDGDETSFDDNSDRHTKQHLVHPVDETFFYVKEHNVGSTNGKSNNNDNKDSIEPKNATLFVANCPTAPNISTKILLQSIFGRFGEVVRVTVIPKPPSGSNHHRVSSVTETYSDHDPYYHWTTQYSMKPSYFSTGGSNSIEEVGQFAHVVFASTKEMKRTFRALQDIMMSSSDKVNTKGNKTMISSTSLLSHNLPAITFDKIELQTLADESDRQWRAKTMPVDDDDDDYTVPYGSIEHNKSNVLNIASQFRKSCQTYSDRQELLNECNAVMEAYEDAEETAERRKREMASMPDEDGFVTVSYGTTDVGDIGELEMSTHQKSATSASRRPGNKRLRTSKKKKGLGGAEPLPDFYRFQTREHRKKSIHELRTRFEDDLKRIQKMKEN
jgi:ribosomal RNA-processing protein 7